MTESQPGMNYEEQSDLLLCFANTILTQAKHFVCLFVLFV